MNKTWSGKFQLDKANTSLQEVSHWKFLIYPETTWIDWEIIEAEFLTIE